MTGDQTELATRIEAVVRGLPGVRDVYAAAPLLAQAIGELPVGATTRPTLVHIAAADGEQEVVVNIGVDPEGRAPVTAADVAAAIRAEVGTGMRVTVRVSRIA